LSRDPFLRGGRSHIKDITFKRAWRKLLLNEIEGTNEREATIEEDVEEVIATLHRIPGCGDCADNDIEWFQCDKDKIKIVTKISST
jgi:hypothetical protein